jgi:hypothetical protein
MNKSLIDHTALSDSVYSIFIRLLTGTCAVLCRSFGVCWRTIGAPKMDHSNHHFFLIGVCVRVSPDWHHRFCG